ncbi:hypothetical protein JL722_7382 [Aureococcus anophagefferens]|nr:hypothetical protein JL722_7382 [Aureococcus anophagefferens]
MDADKEPLPAHPGCPAGGSPAAVLPEAPPAASQPPEGEEKAPAEAEASLEDDGPRQCRICFDSDEPETLVRACLCNAWVHIDCLNQWRQGRYPKARRECNVCRARWTTAAPRREMFERRVRTAPRYRPAAEADLDEPALRSKMRVGCLISQSAARADVEALVLREGEGSKRERNSQLQRLLSRPFSTREGEGDDERAAQRERAEAEAEAAAAARPAPRPSLVSRLRAMLSPPRASAPPAPTRPREAPPRVGTMASLMAAVLRARAQRHWHKGCFVVLFVGDGSGSDGSDAIVAANLTREVRVLGDDGEADEDDGRRRRLSWLRSLRDGARRALAPAPRAGARAAPPDAAAPDAAAESESDGGPVYRNEPLGLLMLWRPEGSDDAGPDDAALRAAVGDVVPWRPDATEAGGPSRAFVGAVPLLRKVWDLHGPTWRAEALAWSGVAVWSADQLLAEVSRGSWVLSSATWRDLSDDAAHDGPHALWSAVVARDGAVSAAAADAAAATTNAILS